MIAEKEILLPEDSFSFRNRKRWTRCECDFMERAGLLPERYELLDGEIIVKVGQNQPHVIAVTLLVKCLIALFGGDFVLCQLPIEIAEPDRQRNRPEPDVTVLRRPITDFPQTPPGPEDIHLVAEISDATLRHDLTTKAALYARAEIAEYWVLDVPSRRLIRHCRSEDGIYREITAFTEDETVALPAAPDNAIAISDLLPPVVVTE